MGRKKWSKKKKGGAWVGGAAFAVIGTGFVLLANTDPEELTTSDMPALLRLDPCLAGKMAELRACEQAAPEGIGNAVAIELCHECVCNASATTLITGLGTSCAEELFMAERPADPLD